MLFTPSLNLGGISSWCRRQFDKLGANLITIHLSSFNAAQSKQPVMTRKGVIHYIILNGEKARQKSVLYVCIGRNRS